MPRITNSEDTAHVNLQLMNGERVDALVRTDDLDRVFTTRTFADEITVDLGD